MLGYVTIGALDSEASGKFYDAVFGAMGAERKFADGGWIGYGAKGSDTHNVYVCPPHDKQPARAGNGTMIAFKAGSKDEVTAAYEAGLKNGGPDEGAPGPRPADSKTFFGTYLRDPTGNKICALHIVSFVAHRLRGRTTGFTARREIGRPGQGGRGRPPCGGWKAATALAKYRRPDRKRAIFGSGRHAKCDPLLRPAID